MNRRNAQLITLLVLALSAPLGGCDATAKLTEQEHIQRAKDFEDKGNLKGSIIELKNAIQKNPDSPQARLLLGQVYLKAGFGAEAEKELSRAEELGVSRDSIAPLLGEAWLLMGQYKRILDELQPVDTLSSANRGRIMALRASALFKFGKLQEACNLFQASHAVFAGNLQAHWGLAQCAIAEHKMAEARIWLDNALKLNERQSETWVFIGDLEQLNQNTPHALAAYQQAVKLAPSNIAALQSLATLQMTQGDMTAAQTSIDAVKKIAPNSIAAKYLQAFQKFQQKKYPEARDFLQDVFKTAPEHLPSILLMGSTAYALDDLQQAETYLNRYLKHFPGHVYARRVLAATQIKQKQPDKALATLAPLLPPHGEDATAMALASQAHLAQQDPRQATQLLQQAVLLQPGSAAFHTQLGLNRLSAGDISAAIGELKTAQSLNSGSHRADVLLALTYIKNKQYSQALAISDQLEKQLPRSPLPHDLRGRALLAQGDPTSARAGFERALALDATFFPASASLAQLDMRDNKPDAARGRFTQLLAADKNNLRAMMALAEIAALTGQETEYVNWLEKAIKAHPQAIAPNSTLVRYHLIKKQPRKALAIATEMARERPDDVQALNLLGSTQFAAGEVNSAITTYNKAVQKDARDIGSHLGLARALIADKKPAAARTALQKALQIDPRHLESRVALLRLETSQNQPEAALRIARQIQAEQPQSAFGHELEADVLAAQKRYPAASAAYEHAMKLGAKSGVLIKLHNTQVLAGSGQASARRLADWLKQHPEDNAVRAAAANYAMATGNNREAIAHYQEIQRQAAPSVPVLNNLATLYQREKDPRALATAEQAFKLAPTHPNVQDTLGWILLETDQTARGLDLLRRAAAAAPKSSSIRYHYAVALARSGDKARARAELQQLLADTPAFAEAQDAKALLNSL
ncbi:MAG: XrtA/PEP-CTERM system TPR-repeat protein PrsT [Thiobacillus sp.]|nr:XrtA/PEP-CTERM system TPR-repeat protein PrsT [Thiobacillus sp.]